MKKLLVLFFAGMSMACAGQLQSNVDSLRNAYNAEMKAASSTFSETYYPNRHAIYSLNEKEFIKVVDSLQRIFLHTINRYKPSFKKIDDKFISSEQSDVTYFFDRIVLDYTYFHENYTGQKTHLSKLSQERLDRHLADFNNPEMISSRDYREYVAAFLRHKSSTEVKLDLYKLSDNKRLDAYLNLIPKYFSNQECRDYWEFHYLTSHIEDFGNKNIEKSVRSFLSTCKNLSYRRKIDSLYNESLSLERDHLDETYKTIDGYSLDMHIFLPDSLHQRKVKRPVMVYFSGGSWTQGNPSWAFYSCKRYAKEGWVAVSVEYRLADRHETTPFEAVKDARSAIRWLRLNADTYNIDVNRIVASGNSAGGHLVLTTALADEWNEETDRLELSASPNLLLVNAGVYSLYREDITDWITRDLKDKNLVKKISPQHLLRKGLPPMLIIHGTNDQSVEYSSAEAFAETMHELGNEFEFQTLEGAPHYIWFDRRFSDKVTKWRSDFLKKYGYEQ